MDKINLVRKTTYFRKLDDQDFNAIMHCMNARIIHINKGETIVNIGDKISNVYLIISGKTRAYSIDEDGNMYLNLDYEKNQMFGLRDIINERKNFTESLYALENTDIVLLDKFRLLNPTLNRCQRHIELMKACFLELARQNQVIESHKNILSINKTSDKIMAYLKYNSYLNKSSSFDIPYSRQEMANYLGVERSALSNELSKLKKSGSIDFYKSHFTIID